MACQKRTLIEISINCRNDLNNEVACWRGAGTGKMKDAR
jgi:hypothetical protein